MSWQSTKNLFPVAWETMCPSISVCLSMAVLPSKASHPDIAVPSVNVVFLAPVSHPLVTAVSTASSRKQFLPSFPLWHFLCQKWTHQTQSPLSNLSTWLLFFGLPSPEINFTPSFRILLIKFNYWNVSMNKQKKISEKCSEEVSG